MLKYLDPNVITILDPIQVNPEDLELIFKSQRPGLEYFKLSKNSSLYTAILNKFPQEFHEFINSSCTVGIQSMDNRFNNYLHTSGPNSYYAVNYTLLSGGESVYTTTFDSGNENMQVYNIPLNTWYYLSTHTLHKVEGITSIRTEISIIIPIENSQEFMTWLDSVSLS